MGKEWGIRELMADLGYDFIGALAYSVGIHCFTAPNQIAPGGVSGLAIIINYYFPFLPIGTLSLCMNLPLIFLALRFLGRKFTLSTLKTLLVVTVVLDVLFLGVPVYTGNPLLASLFGGVSLGAGLGIIFMRGSTTGGSDILMRLLQLKFPHLSMGKLMMLLDLVVLLLSVVAFQNIESGLYGLIAIYASSHFIDAILYGMDKGQLAYIFSLKNEEIARRIMEELGRGVTFLQATGAYSGEERQVSLCAVRQVEFYKVKRIIHEVDPEAFLIVSEVGEILGEGFRPINKG